MLETGCTLKRAESVRKACSLVWFC